VGRAINGPGADNDLGPGRNVMVKDCGWDDGVAGCDWDCGVQAESFVADCVE
jgi:hypothetical protein